jgi:hypothetical protein
MGARNRRSSAPTDRISVTPGEFISYSLDMLIALKSMAQKFELFPLAKELSVAIKYLQKRNQQQIEKRAELTSPIPPPAF